jgi:hypothetical protein
LVAGGDDRLGHTHRDLGKVAEAIEVYERARALKAGFPEVETELVLLRKAVLPPPAGTPSDRPRAPGRAGTGGGVTPRRRRARRCP